jgi:hypothetical protein
MQRHWTEKFMSPALVSMRSTLLQRVGLKPLGSSADRRIKMKDR